MPIQWDQATIDGKLEFSLAEAIEERCESVATVGAIQSNHARITAIAGAMCGLDVHLVLGGKYDGVIEGNLVLSALSGAHFHFVDTDDWDELDSALSDVCDELQTSGVRVHRIPLGASTPIGVLGYARGYLELLEQLDTIGEEGGYVVHASSSGGTHAGLLLGRTLAGRGPMPLGVDVARVYGTTTALEDHVFGLARDTAAIIGMDLKSLRSDVLCEDATGAEYGVPTEVGLRAMTAATRYAGFLVDPIYSGKALGAVEALAARGVLPGGPIVFLHTGGVPAAFTRRFGDTIAHASLLSDMT